MHFDQQINVAIEPVFALRHRTKHADVPRAVASGYTQKTGTPAHCPLPPELVTLLEGLRNDRQEFFFWDGKSERETTVKSWSRVFQKLFASTDPPIVGGHAHRFRDTFAVSLLLKGVDLANVSILLGHGSIKVTERHYSPWVQARQEQLEADVRRTWPQPKSKRAEGNRTKRKATAMSSPRGQSGDSVH